MSERSERSAEKALTDEHYEWHEQVGRAVMFATRCTHEGDDFGSKAVCVTCFSNAQAIGALVERFALRAFEQGRQAERRDWEFTADLSAPDEDRRPWLNPYCNPPQKCGAEAWSALAGQVFCRQPAGHDGDHRDEAGGEWGRGTDGWRKPADPLATQCPTCIHPEGYDRLSGPCPTCGDVGVTPPPSTWRARHVESGATVACRGRDEAEAHVRESASGVWVAEPVTFGSEGDGHPHDRPKEDGDA